MTASSPSISVTRAGALMGWQIGCDNGEKVRVAFELDCCDQEAMGHVATTAGVTAADVRDLMTATVEQRYGPVNRARADRVAHQ